jgi:hypothetical protein
MNRWAESVERVRGATEVGEVSRERERERERVGTIDTDEDRRLELTYRSLTGRNAESVERRRKRSDRNRLKYEEEQMIGS